MPYEHIDWNKFTDRDSRKIFSHVDALLFDVYGIFRMLPPADKDGGGGNFTCTLVLLCIIDGLATLVWPGKETQQEKQKRFGWSWLCPWRSKGPRLHKEKRFKRLIRCRLSWGPEGKGKWLNKGTAADQLYTEFRNLLVHELGRDRPSNSRANDYGEPVIGRWGQIPIKHQDISEIDSLAEWNAAWPLLYETKDDDGNARYKLANAALYWAVKKLAKDMIYEQLVNS